MTTCPRCGEPVTGAFATEPGVEQYTPCGCRVATDGGSIQPDGGERGARSVDGTERIKFADVLVPKVLNEEKDAAVRYDGYEDVQVGDTLTAVTEDGAPFAELNVRRTASVLAVEAHSVLEVFGADYPSAVPQDVIDALNEHYVALIRPGTTVRVLVFEVVRHV